jgi:hypothetical protein
MSDVDTSAEAVEAIAKRLKRDIDWRPGSLCEQAAATLRALLAERDAAHAEVARLREALEKIAAREPNAVGGGKRAIEYDLMRYEARAALADEAPHD